ncbi:hypothetical protein BD770DRAFT_415213 [Pilaira anomala]|nr:hypothetical protein BD770DRAFT_415213 [Pilaira anomala]
MPVLSFPPKQTNLKTVSTELLPSQLYPSIKFNTDSGILLLERLLVSISCSCSTERRISVPQRGQSLIERSYSESFLKNLTHLLVQYVVSKSKLPNTCSLIAHPSLLFGKNIIFEFLWPTVTIPDIITALSPMNFHDIRYVQKSGSTAQMIVYITLANVWKGHFRSSFDSTPFLGPVIFLQTKKKRYCLSVGRRSYSLKAIVLACFLSSF